MNILPSAVESIQAQQQHKTKAVVIASLFVFQEIILAKAKTLSTFWDSNPTFCTLSV
jgi:hypothetical protein